VQCHKCGKPGLGKAPVCEDHLLEYVTARVRKVRDTLFSPKSPKEAAEGIYSFSRVLRPEIYAVGGPQVLALLYILENDPDPLMRAAAAHCLPSDHEIRDPDLKWLIVARLIFAFDREVTEYGDNEFVEWIILQEMSQHKGCHKAIEEISKNARRRRIRKAAKQILKEHR
jgi:hypothetical protein